MNFLSLNCYYLSLSMAATYTPPCTNGDFYNAMERLQLQLKFGDANELIVDEFLKQLFEFAIITGDQYKKMMGINNSWPMKSHLVAINQAKLENNESDTEKLVDSMIRQFNFFVYGDYRE